jgi:CRP/FNR family transcriptional regulator
MQLEMRGLIETAPPHGLRLKNVAALEEIANEQTDEPAWPSENDLRALLQ